MHLTDEQAKAGLTGENAEDTLLFIVAKLLRGDDTDLRRYVQQPHILVSTLLRVEQELIFGDVTLSTSAGGVRREWDDSS